MSLLDYLQQTKTDASVSLVTTNQFKQELRESLYNKLSSKQIAELLSDDKQRAIREVKAVLEQLSISLDSKNLPVMQRAAIIQDVLNLVVGLGPLEELLKDPSVTEIMVNGPDKVFYERDGHINFCDVSFDDEQQLRMVIDRIVGPLGRRVDEQSPLVSGRLKQGHRINVVIPPLALDGSVLTIRKFREQTYTLEELTNIRSIDHPIAQLLKWAVLARKNIAVSGSTGGGKTTLLNALSEEIPKHERIITIEDAAELRFSSHPHVVRLETRMKNVEGSGEVSIRDLVINALRMRPDRIVVGECRGAEAIDMLQAMNTGHDGSLTTLHANSPVDVISRLVMMSRYAMDLPVEVIEEQIGSAIDLIVQIDRLHDGTRKVTEICGCSAKKGHANVQTIVKFTPDSKLYSWHSIPDWLKDLKHHPHIDYEEVQGWCRCIQQHL